MRRKVSKRLRKIADILFLDPEMQKRYHQQLKKRYRSLPWLKRHWWITGMERYVSKIEADRKAK